MWFTVKISFLKKKKNCPDTLKYYTTVITSAMTMVKSHKKMSKLFSYDSVVKCHRNLNFEKMDTAPYTGKNDGFWLLWEVIKEYIKRNIITAVLRKANAHSVVICRLIKKSIM